jgi:hypothetical protein
MQAIFGMFAHVATVDPVPRESEVPRHINCN